MKALRNLGFQEHQIEVSEQAMGLKGYRGDTREGKRAHVRIKGSGWGHQNYVGGMSNDLGWEQLEDGSYAFHVSDYDVNKYGKNWQKNLMQQYSREVIKEVAEENNFFIESETTEDGQIFIEARAMF